MPSDDDSPNGLHNPSASEFVDAVSRRRPSYVMFSGHGDVEGAFADAGRFFSGAS